jgi:hypothetical protein
MTARASFSGSERSVRRYLCSISYDRNTVPPSSLLTELTEAPALLSFERERLGANGHGLLLTPAFYLNIIINPRNNIQSQRAEHLARRLAIVGCSSLSVTRKYANLRSCLGAIPIVLSESSLRRYSGVRASPLSEIARPASPSVPPALKFHR